jgi:hypothetical protein
MRAYKFLRSADLPKVREDQTLWLGSAAEIRQAEDGRPGYGDANEFSKKFAPGEYRLELTNDHPLIRSLGLGGSSSKPVTMIFEDGSAFQIESNGLMFCVSIDRSPGMVARMAKEFEYDASFEIRDFGALCRAIRQALGECAQCGFGPVVYEDGDQRSETVLNRGPWNKDLRFDWQKEFRFVAAVDGPGRAVHIPGLWRFVGAFRLHAMP